VTLTNVTLIVILGTNFTVMAGYAIYIFISPSVHRPPMGGVILLIGAEWLLAELLEYVSPGLSMKVLWNHVKYIGITSLPVAWVGFCLQFTGRQDRATPRNYMLLSMVPFTLIVLTFTNELHGLMWSVIPSPTDGFGFLTKRYHAGFWVLILYSYTLFGIGVIQLIPMFVKSRHLYRRQTRAVLAGGVMALVASAFDASGIELIKGFDVIPLAFSVTSLIVMYGFTRLKFSDTAPLAYQATIESLQETVIVLDADNRFMYMNPAGYRIFPDALPRPVGKHLSQFCPELVPILERVSATDGGRGDIVLGERVYDVTVAPLPDWQGKLVSKIAVLREITHLVAAREELRRANEDLERKVLERTQALSESNQALRAEIGERKRVEEALQGSLREKEVLLKEIHHRVKNNLQVITSLLRLPLRDITDRHAVTVLMETFDRVKSIALIHEILHKSDDISRLPLSQYIRSLIENLVSSQGAGARDIVVSTEAEDVRMDIDTGIVCGLLINELVSNSFRHAFPEGRKGKIWVRLSASDDKTILTVGDDGVGIPEGLDPYRADSLGLKIVNTLTRQLDGKVELDRSHGTEFRISFSAQKK
jgi:two-component sensor histidine kinase/PAS domain-containing protein